MYGGTDGINWSQAKRAATSNYKLHNKLVNAISPSTHCTFQSHQYLQAKSPNIIKQYSKLYCFILHEGSTVAAAVLRVSLPFPHVVLCCTRLGCAALLML